MVKRIALITLILFAFILAIENKVNNIAFIGEDAIPQRINYQGYLTDNAGNPINQSLSMTFRIFDAASGGNQLWSETQTVSVENGLFNVILGEVNAISPDIFTPGARRWLELVIDGNPLSPRTEITAVGFSYKTVDADKLDGETKAQLDSRWVNEGQSDAISTGMIQDNAVTTGKILNGTILMEDLSFTPATRPLTPPAATDEIANNAITSVKIENGQVQTVDIADNAVNSAKIADGNVTTPDIGANQVTLGKIERGSVSGRAIISQGTGADPIWSYPNALGTNSPNTLNFLRFGSFTLDLGQQTPWYISRTSVYFSGLQVGDIFFVIPPDFPAMFGPDTVLTFYCNTLHPTLNNRFYVYAYCPADVPAFDPPHVTFNYIWIRPGTFAKENTGSVKVEIEKTEYFPMANPQKF